MTPTQAGVPSDAIEASLKALVRTQVRPDIDPEKSRQYSDLRKLQWYWLGEQFLTRTKVGDHGAEWKPINGQWTENQTAGDSRVYAYYTNDIRGTGRKFISVCSQQPPTIKAAPNKEDNEDHVILARKADLAARSLYQLWDIKRQYAYIFLTFWKAGPAFARVRWVADPRKYGETEIPVMEMQQQPDGAGSMRCMQCGAETPVEGDIPPAVCPQCGAPFSIEDFQPPQMVDVPFEAGRVRYANGCAEFEILNSMYVSTPFDIRDIKDTPWLIYERELHAATILSAYRQKANADPRMDALYRKLRRKLVRDQVGGGSDGDTDTSDGRYTRAVATSYNGQEYGTRLNRHLFQEVYLRPGMLEMIPDEAARSQLAQESPEGLKVTFIDGEYVEHEAALIDDEWIVRAPEVYETVYADPIAKDMLSAQDFSNAILNITAETWERNIPQILANIEMISYRDQVHNRLPANIIPARPKQGMRLADAVEKLPQATPDPGAAEYSAAWREHAAQIVGITPSIYGGGEREQTAYAANLKKNQAMIQLSMSINAARELIAKSLELGVKCLAKYSNGRVPSPWAPATEADQVDLAELLDGGWHLEAEDSMPMSPGEQRAAIFELMEKVGSNPAFFDLFNFTDPDNINEIAGVVGIPEWNVRNQESNRKFRATLRKLLAGTPVEGPPMMDPMTGMMMPGELQPSVPVDEFEDDHAFMAHAVQLWAQGEEAELVRSQRPENYANVIAWGKGHAKLMQPMMPPPGAEPPSPGDAPQPGGGPPAPVAPPAPPQ